MRPDAAPRRIAPPAPVAKRTPGEVLTEIERLAARLSPALAEALAAYLARVRDLMPLRAIEDALRQGNAAAVLGILDGLDLAESKAAVEEALRAILWAAGALVATRINLRLRGAAFVFDKVNPQLLAWLRGYSLGLIREIDRGTKENVRAALVEGMAKGQNPVATARAVKAAVGLTAKQQKAVGNYRKQLETFHLRTSAKGWNLGAKIDRVNGRQVFRPDEDGSPLDGIDERRLRDFRFDGALRRAMETGKPLDPKKIDQMVEAYERKFLRHRAETIARTESLRTTNVGVQEAWRQAIDAGKATASLVRRQWIVTKDERTCEFCGPVPKMNPKRGVRMDEPFKTPKGPVMLPPLHPQCRCTVFLRQWEPEQLANP